MRSGSALPVRVLACDNSPSFLLLLTHWLEDHDDIDLVGTTARAQDAAGLAADRVPHVVITDTFQPGGDLAMLRAVRAAAPACRILLHTGYAEHQLPGGLVALVDAVVRKGFDEGTLVGAIRALGLVADV